MQAVLEHALQNIDAQALGAARVERQRLVVLVHLALQLLQRAVGFGARQRGHQVVDDDRLRAPLGLAALAGVVDDERVQVRQRAKNGIRPAGRAQRHAFAGQPLQVAVLADVYHRVHGKLAPQPKVKRQISVRRHQIRIVVGGDQINIAATRRLDANKHLPQPQPADHKAALAHHRVGLGRAPQGVDGGAAVRVNKLLKRGLVLLQRQALLRRAGVVGVEAVGHASHQRGNQVVAVGGQFAGDVASALQSAQQGDGGGGRVQPHAVGQPRIVVGVIGQNQRQALVGIRFAAQRAPALGQFGDEIHALGRALVAHHIHLGALAAPRQAFKADGSGANAAIHFGHDHLHRQITRGETVRVLLPLLLAAAGGDELQHWRIAGQRRGLHAGHAGVVGRIHRGNGKAGGVQHHIDAVLLRQRLQQL